VTTWTRRGFFGLLAGGALALLAGRWVAGLYADWAFFEAVGFGEVWRGKAIASSVLTAGTFVAVAVFAFLNFFAVRQSIVSLVLPQRLGDLEIAEAVPTQRLTFVAIVLALVVALLFALLPHDWSSAALAWDRLSFRESEPYLERDLGFYVAWLPFERALQERATIVLVTIGMLVLAAYAATPSIRWGATGLYVSAWVRRHLAFLTGGFILLVGWDWRLDRYERLSDGSGIWGQVAGHSLFAAYDHRIALPYLGITSFLAVPIAAVLVWAGWRGYLRLTVALLSAMIVAGPVASAVLPLMARGPLSTLDARRREQPYLNTSALFTRRAFGVDEIAGADTTPLRTIDISELSRRVSAWDPAALSEIVAADPRGGVAGGLAWRATPDGLEALVLRHPAEQGATATRWSVDAIRAPRGDAAGRPYLAPAVGESRVDGVLIAPGLTGFALTSDPANRIAAPDFETTLTRMALSWDLQDPRLLFRELPGLRPRLVTSRDVRTRVRRVVPFLAVGPTVTPVVRGDSLYWFVELFSTAAHYPLSEAVTSDGESVRYAKHAGAAIVQAQTGRVMLVPTERPDPLMAYWIKRFPGAFTPLAGAPDWVRAERPPALDVMVVQGRALARVGFQGDSAAWRRLTRADDADADLDAGAATQFQFGADEALGWALPVDIPSVGRTVGIIVARGGALQRTEYHEFGGLGWTAVLDQLQFSADSAGFGRALPDMRRGRVQTIPSSIGPLWIQSYYQWPPDGSPVLAGVVVTSPRETKAGRTLAEALGEAAPSDALPPDAFRERVARLYDAMQAAQRISDWRAYGEAWSALGRLIGRQ
jgi:uncharacterized membrane protein (UPF0182 family)